MYRAFQKKSAPIKAVDDNGVWNRLISSKTGEWKEGITVVNGNPKLWIQNNILKENGDSLELSGWIESLAKKLN